MVKMKRDTPGGGIRKPENAIPRSKRLASRLIGELTTQRRFFTDPRE
jgi:hypothetical protein